MTFVLLDSRQTPSSSRRRLGWRAVFGVACLVLGSEMSAQEPADIEATLFLELVINGTNAERIAEVRQRGEHFTVSRADLEGVRVSLPEGTPDPVEIDRLPGVTVVYERYAQQLLLDVPPAWLPMQRIKTSGTTERSAQRSSPGVLLNYDVYHSRSSGASGASGWLEGRAFGTWGALSNTAILRHTAATAPKRSDTAMLRYDTTWSRVDDRRLLSYSAGDITTGALSWTSAVQLGGVSFSRSFQTRPDLVTYPLPEFAGQVAVPSTVDLIVNGTAAAHADVAPGPFSIGTLPLMNGAGTATIVTTDALGRQMPQTMKFYVAGSLLRRGFLEYSLSAGVLRRQLGQRSFSYGGTAWSGSAKYGLSNTITVQAHGEGGSRLSLGGGGAEFALGRFGVGSSSTAFSHAAAGLGTQWSLGYAYTAGRFSVSAQRLQRSTTFADLSAADASVPVRLSRQTQQVTGAVSLGKQLGTLGAGYFAVVGRDQVRSGTTNVSFNRGIAGRASAFATLGWRTGTSRGWSSQLQLVVPVGNRASATAALSSSTGGSSSTRLQYGQSVPTEGGLGWTAGYDNQDAYRQVDLTWRQRYAQVAGGVFGRADRMTTWSTAAGSVVAMGGGVFPANRISDSFALVDAERSGIPVYFENQLMGTTNRAGHLLVPSVPAHYSASYAIDPLNLPSNVDAAVVEQRVAVNRRVGAIVRFALTEHLSAIVALVDGWGDPLPVGASVKNRHTGALAVVGWDGIVYLEDVANGHDLEVRKPDRTSCVVRILVDGTHDGIAHLGPLVCR